MMKSFGFRVARLPKTSFPLYLNQNAQFSVHACTHVFLTSTLMAPPLVHASAFCIWQSAECLLALINILQGDSLCCLCPLLSGVASFSKPCHKVEGPLCPERPGPLGTAPLCSVGSAVTSCHPEAESRFPVLGSRKPHATSPRNCESPSPAWPGRSTPCKYGRHFRT
jgi:hypothetical protein